MSGVEEFSSPIVSVIIPCFNDGRYLDGAIKSVEAADPSFWELIVVNDGSTCKETLDVLRGIEMRGYKVVHQVNRGLGAARNEGIRSSRGKYILPLDADNRIRPEYISKSLMIMEQDESVAIVHSNATLCGLKTGPWRVPDFDLQDMFVTNYIDACAVYRRAVWEDCGGYDEGMLMNQGLEDWDFWLSAGSRGWRFVHVDQELFEYQVRKGSMIDELHAAGRNQDAVAFIMKKHALDLHREYVDVVRELKIRRSHANDLKKNPFRTLVRLAIGKLAPVNDAG